MADDYISKSKALALIQAERDYLTNRKEYGACHILTHCGFRIIDDMPAEPDVVKIVRCKYCSWRDGSKCNRHFRFVIDEDYCSRGEIEEDDPT